MKDLKYSNIYYPPGGILMWIIIFLELITFGMAVVAFAISAHAESEIFKESSLQLNTTIGSINTVVLILSGYCMARAVQEYKAANITMFFQLVKLTILGGIIFILFKTVEYSSKIQDNLLIDTNTFFTFYWFLTLFHLVHVIVGIIILLVTYYNVKKHNSSETINDIEAAAAFWHMCDLIWLHIFPILYLLN